MNNNLVTLEESDILSHLILEDRDIATELAGSNKWKLNKELEMVITVNGVNLPANALRDLLDNMWEQAVNRAPSTVTAEEFRKRVEDRADKMVKEQAAKLLEKMEEVRHTLESSSDIINWGWEE